MKPRTSLKIITGISILGMLFSGYLSYGELARQTCSLGGCSNIVGVPVCILGFLIYLITFIIAISGLFSKKN